MTMKNNNIYDLKETMSNLINQYNQIKNELTYDEINQSLLKKMDKFEKIAEFIHSDTEIADLFESLELVQIKQKLTKNDKYHFEIEVCTKKISKNGSQKYILSASVEVEKDLALNLVANRIKEYLIETNNRQMNEYDYGDILSITPIKLTQQTFKSEKKMSMKCLENLQF